MSNRDDDQARTYPAGSARDKGTGPNSAGQSGDTQGLSGEEESGSESVEELVEEGQSFEADALQGVEDAEEDGADDKGVKELHTRQVPEDDVPDEYINQDRPI